MCFTLVAVDIQTHKSRSRETVTWRRNDGSWAMGAGSGNRELWSDSGYIQNLLMEWIQRWEERDFWCEQMDM